MANGASSCRIGIKCGCLGSVGSAWFCKDAENCGGTEIPPEYQQLTSHKDWNLLVYPPPQNTTEPVLNPTPGRLNNRTMLLGSFPAQEMDQYTFRALINADWLDQTATMVFGDGFESK